MYLIRIQKNKRPINEIQIRVMATWPVILTRNRENTTGENLLSGNKLIREHVVIIGVPFPAIYLCFTSVFSGRRRSGEQQQQQQQQ